MAINPDDIPMLKEVYPTEEEFSDFQSYVTKLDQESQIHGHGGVKIIPPKSWKACSLDYQTLLQNLKVIGPIEQNFHSHSMRGFYELLLIQKKSMSALDYQKRSLKLDQDTDNLSIGKVEEKFWRSLSFNPPLYGADVKGSLFDTKVPWNLNELKTILNDGLERGS